MTQTFTSVGRVDGTVPAGICAVQATGLGGAGGSAISADATNGAGARVTATYRVVPGQTFSVDVGGGGGRPTATAQGQGVGGVNGGGDGGRNGLSNGAGAYHHGAGGGGWTEIEVGGQTLIVAGGGGGSAGGHNSALGFGGDAGLPVAAGVTAGTDGRDGRNGPNNQPPRPGIPGGGQGGQVSGPGAGGEHTAVPELSGNPGSGRNGGSGNYDPDPDAGGGGGGGYFGGGAGSGSDRFGDGAPTATGVTGAGGGGGASYVNPDGPTGTAVTDISSASGPKRNGQGVGADGNASLTWIACDYDLSIAKSVSPERAAPGTAVTWTVSVTNEGPEPMSLGDTVTITDDLPGDGPHVVTSIEVAGGSNSVLSRGPVTCDAAVGDELSSPVECSREYSAPGAAESPSGGARGLDVGESLTIRYTSVVPGPSGTETTNTATVTDRGDGANNTASATVAAVDEPVVRPDQTSGPQGQAQRVSPLQNDGPGENGAQLDPSTLTLIDDEGNAVDQVTVDGEGTYTVDRSDPANPVIVFQPEPAFVGTATPVRYEVSDENGLKGDSTYTPTVTPVAVPDTTRGPQGVEQRVDPLANDDPNGDVELDPSSLTLVDADGNPTTTVAIPGEGVYTLDDGEIVFTPEPDFVGTATPVRYRVSDVDGNAVESTYTPVLDPVAPEASPDETSGPQGRQQSVNPLANDKPGDPAVPLDPDSLTLLDADGNAVDELSFPEGTFTIDRSDPANPRIVFQPAPGFIGTAPSAPYRIADVNGTAAASAYTPTVTGVTPEARPDATSGPKGKPQSIDPLANDHPGHADVPLDPRTLTLVDAQGNPVDELVIPDQGRYTIDRTDPDRPLIVFTPEPDFVGTATPVSYRIADVNGTVAESTYTPTLTYESTPPAAGPSKDAPGQLPVTGSAPWGTGMLVLFAVTSLVIGAVLRRRVTSD